MLLLLLLVRRRHAPPSTQLLVSLHQLGPDCIHRSHGRRSTVARVVTVSITRGNGSCSRGLSARHKAVLRLVLLRAR